MDPFQSSGYPETAAPMQSVGGVQTTFDINNQQDAIPCFEEGDSSNDDSGFHTQSSGESQSEIVDRDALSHEILDVLTEWPEISIELIDWARIFIEEEPQMLTHSSTIVDAHPDRERAHIEFDRGLRAICRIISDERLKTVNGYAVQLRHEWLAAIAATTEEVRFGDFMDLIYSEAERILEKGEGDHREEGDMDVVEKVFGFARKEMEEEDGAEGEQAKEEDAMNAEG